MRRLYEFRCSKEHLSEKFVDESVMTVPCDTEGCSDRAERIISAVRCKLDPISGHFPGATAKWAENRQKQIQHERKSDNHGDPDW